VSLGSFVYAIFATLFPNLWDMSK